MSEAVDVSAATWSQEWAAIAEELQGQEVEVWVDHPDDHRQRMLAKLHLQAASVEAKGSERGGVLLSLSGCCNEEGILVHHIRAPEAMTIDRDHAGQIECVAILSRSQGRHMLRVPEEEAAPGRRHLSFRPDPGACTHPNCPIARPIPPAPTRQLGG